MGVVPGGLIGSEVRPDPPGNQLRGCSSDLSHEGAVQDDTSPPAAHQQAGLAFALLSTQPVVLFAGWG